MRAVDPLDLFLWTFRRSERDVINLYDSLSDVMTLATGGDMINFGFWDEGVADPVAAQRRLCSVFAEAACIGTGERILDVGCGYAAPAAQWHDSHASEFLCVNINMGQLRGALANPAVSAKLGGADGLRLINATATSMPFADGTADRILAFESPQHFKPLESFISECMRILRPGGTLAMTLPILSPGAQPPIVRLGLLAMTWSSEHYTERFVLSLLDAQGFQVTGRREIGPRVYKPLADYYERHRDAIRKRILARYPQYVESILNRSMRKMRHVSENGTIGYTVLSCKKPE